MRTLGTPVTFLSATDHAATTTFFRDVLGLEEREAREPQHVYAAGDTTVRVVFPGDFTPQPFTVLGWESPDIESDVDALVAKGVTFLVYEGFGQDERGIWTAPSGAKVAWFSDPAGNVLSLSQH